MKLKFFTAVAALCLLVRISSAEIKLPALFSDNMVLQSAAAVPFWGWADAGEQVTVAFGGKSAKATANSNGRWQVELDLSQPPVVASEMSVSGSKSAAPRVIKNVAVGQVWLASGQSNMEKPLGPHVGQHPVDRFEQEVADSANPAIRVFTVTPKASAKPLDDCQGKWEVASPQTTAHFTAAGYFFAREINKALHVPVGIIHSSWGGTRVESWTSSEGSAADPELSKLAEEERRAQEQYPRALNQYHMDLADWTRAHGCLDPGNTGEERGWANPATATSDWQPVNMGSGKKGSITPGIRWYRKTVSIPANWNGHTAYLSLANVCGFDTAYFNNTRVGGTDVNSAERSLSRRMYLVPASLIKPGDATIALRVVSHLPANSPITEAYRMALVSVSNIGLGGPWLYKTEAGFPTPDAAAIAAYPTPPSVPPQFDTASYLFNGMIHPLIPYRIAGAIWYQGESNASIAPWVAAAHPTSHWYHGDGADPAALYFRAFPALIRDWRAQWSQAAGAADDFPFYYCQIANFGPKSDHPADSNWAEVREAQLRTLGLVPNTGMAVLIDIGLAKDIHPTNKQEVGRRLALLALAQTYGRKDEFSGPFFKSMTVEGDRVRVKFTHAAGGLVARPLPETYQPQSYLPATVPLIKPRPSSELQGFELAGPDGKWQWADAKIEGDSVIVSSPSVPTPVAVRYAWSDDPTCNLYNQSNLPASPFRSDQVVR